MGTEFYGKPDYEKARKIIEADKLRVLIRNRIGITDCWHGKPLRPKWDSFYDSVKGMIQDYLDVYDSTQEYNIDAIMDFMPAEYTETGVYPAMGEPGDEFYVEPTPYDMREHYREMFLAIWCHDKGLAGWLEEEFKNLHGKDVPYDLAEAKAFNRLCRSVDEENRNNAKIAEYILSEGIEPPSDSEYKEALKDLNQSLDNGEVHEWYGTWPDFREQKGLPTNISYELVPNPDFDDGYAPIVRPITPQPKAPEVDENLEVYTTCGATRIKGSGPVEPLEESLHEAEPEADSPKSGFGITEWADSKMNPLKTTNPPLYYVLLVLLSPVMIPLAVIEGLLQGIYEGVKGPKKKQWYQQDDDGNWVPVVIDEVTGETVPGEGLS